MITRLPEIQDELERSVQKTQGLLAQLPREPSRQPVNEVATLLHKFVADVVQHITGIPDEKGLIQSIRPAQERFRREIRATAPKFRSYEKKLAGTRSMPRAEFLANEDDVYSEDESAQPAASDTSTGKRKRRNSVVYVDEVFERAQRYVGFTSHKFVSSRCIFLSAAPALENYRAIIRSLSNRGT